MDVIVSSSYQKAAFEAIGFQALIWILSTLILDGGTTATICGVAAVVFWLAAAMFIWRRAQAPTRMDLELLRFGYLLVVAIVFLCFWIASWLA